MNNWTYSTHTLLQLANFLVHLDFWGNWRLRKPGKAKDGQSPAASEYSNAVSKIFFLYQISNRYIKVKKQNIYKNIILDYINKWTPFINQYQITNFEAHGNGCYVKGLHISKHQKLKY